VDSIEVMLSRIRSRGSGDTLIDEWTECDTDGDVKYATVSAFGDTTHTLIERNGYPKRQFLPGWVLSPLEECLRDSVWSKLPAVELQDIDHVAANQPIGSLVDIVKW
jgi:4-hydroxyphenylpyruvate dioxygenase